MFNTTVMTKEEILDRIQNILNPKVTDTISKLESKEVDKFIHHLCYDIEKSLHNWEHIKTITYNR